MKNQDKSRQTGPTKESLQRQFEQMAHQAPATPPQPISSTRLLGKSIFIVWKSWWKFSLIVSIIACVLWGIARIFAPYSLPGKAAEQLRRDAEVEKDINARIRQYVRSEESLEKGTLLNGEKNPLFDKDLVLSWFSERLREFNQRHGTNVSAQSAILEKAKAAQEIVERNLKLTDGVDWEGGENTQFAISDQILQRGGGDDIDLALLKVAFLRHMGVSGKSAYVVLALDSTKSDMRGVAVILLPGRKEFILDNAKSARSRGSKTYREFVEFGVDHPTRRRWDLLKAPDPDSSSPAGAAILNPKLHSPIMTAFSIWKQ